MLSDGRIELPNSTFILDSNVTENDFLSSIPISERKLLIENESFRTYVLDPKKYSGREFSLTVLFENGALIRLSLSATEVLPAGWKSADRALLVNAKQRNDQWLRNQTGESPVFERAWIKVESVLDGRSWAASVVISFKTAGSGSG